MQKNPNPKERRIVTWTSQEDDILREQITIHGTENWTIIASKFKDKTTRQCRRRWYTYLNSDFKKGGWSPEEDMLLCEAQKIFGNRWTEIAKVVSGRTDNAVKNRFTTLCKKRAKHEAMAKENNVNNKRPFTNGEGFHSKDSLHVGSPLKKMRVQSVPDKDCVVEKLKLRPQFAVLSQNGDKIDALHLQHQVASLEALIEGNRKFEGFAKKDDPKILALMHQAELLSSLAIKVNSQNTEQSLESAWKVLENFLSKSKDDNDQLKDLEDIRSCSTENQPSQRQPDLYDSPSSSEYSTGSTILSTSVSEQFEQTQSEMCTLHEDSGPVLQKIDAGNENGEDTSVSKIIATESINQEEILLQCVEEKNDGDVSVSASSAMEFSSPLQMTPLFTSFAATIPSPQFSESERHFLMKTLGIESPAASRSTNPSQPPPCRRALVHSL